MILVENLGLKQGGIRGRTLSDPTFVFYMTILLRGLPGWVPGPSRCGEKIPSRYELPTSMLIAIRD